MALTTTNESKNTAITLTNESNPHAANLTIDDANWTIDDARGTIDAPHIVLAKESKNALSVTNESKN